MKLDMRCLIISVSAYYLSDALKYDQLTPVCTAQAALAIFNRTISLVDIPTGEKPVVANLGSSGPAEATHTEMSVPLFTATGRPYRVYSSAEVKSYASKDHIPLPSSAAAK